jgi:hypothetical protein
MPIKPENKQLYPDNWPEIRARILARAGNRCEEEGCRLPNHAIGYRDHDGVFHEIEKSMQGDTDAMEAREQGFRIIQIILTVAHLDHNPENCEDSNLRAWCQLHHNRYDREHRNQTIKNNKLKGQLKLL